MLRMIRGITYRTLTFPAEDNPFKKNTNVTSAVSVKSVTISKFKERNERKVTIPTPFSAGEISAAGKESNVFGHQQPLWLVRRENINQGAKVRKQKPAKSSHFLKVISCF